MPETLPPVTPVVPNQARVVGFSLVAIAPGILDNLPARLRPVNYLVIHRLRGVLTGEDFKASEALDGISFSAEETLEFVSMHPQLIRNLRNALESFAVAKGRITNEVTPE
jgi:hypothetical protein